MGRAARPNERERMSRIRPRADLLTVIGERCGNEESLPYMILCAPHRDSATAGAGYSLMRRQFRSRPQFSRGPQKPAPRKSQLKICRMSARLQNEDLRMLCMNTSIRLVTASRFVTVTFSVSATSWQDNSHYVALGPRTGYYIVRPGSSLSHQLGIDDAPTADTDDPFNHGYGADALAFRFNGASILSAPPAYIVQAIPKQFYTQRLGSFIRGQSRLWDAKAFFGQPQRIDRQPDGFIAYYTIQVYNPFENLGGGRK